MLIVVKAITLWEAMPIYSPSGKSEVTVSILIVARNEVDYIEACINSILENDFPQQAYEVLLIDDHSTDRTPELIESINLNIVRIIRMSDHSELLDGNSFKKIGLEIGRKHATGEIILCTDGDCIVPPDWIKTHVSSILEGNICATAPVSFLESRGLLYSFQQIDVMLTMIFTAIGIHSKKFYSANGVNLSYRKKDAVKDDTTKKWASGDDVFLINKLSRLGKIIFLKSPHAIVETPHEPTWKQLWMQRIRWATKSKDSSSYYLNILYGVTFLLSASIVFALVVGLFFSIKIFLVGVGGFLVKMLFDLFLLHRAERFFDRKIPRLQFILSSLIYLPYILFISMFALFPTHYTWKGRRVR